MEPGLDAGDGYGEPPLEAYADELGLDDPGETAAPAFPVVTSFGELIELVGRKRDAKLRVHLEEHASLVKFDAAAGSIDLFLLSGAPPELANELREKLNAWTGRRWIVMLSREKGAPPVGEERRKREAAELEELKRHPAVAALLAEFPDAKIAAVTPLDGAPRGDAKPRNDASRKNETGTG